MKILAVRTHIQTIGYGGSNPDSFFGKLTEMKADYIIDVREDPSRAYLGCYTKAHLEKRLTNYIWIRELGNKSRKMPPHLVDEVVGMVKLKQICNKSKHVVLLCAEKDDTKCHRSYIKQKIIGILDNQE